MSTRKHGNDVAWCFLEDGWDSTKPIEIWRTLGQGQEEVIGYATDKYNAMMLVDALVTAEKVNDDPENKLNKHEVVFLSFVEDNCPEPWSTMAANGILWQDREAYKTLKTKFNEIY